MRRFYQVKLVDMYAGVETVRHVAVLVQFLPRGASTRQMLGGAGAITEEVESLWMVEHTINTVGFRLARAKGKEPEPRDYPLGVLEQEKKAKHAVSRAEAFRRKHHPHTIRDGDQ